MKRLFGSSTILVMGLAAMPSFLTAQETPGLDGVWFATVASAVCGSFLSIPGAPTFRGLYMFSHDGSLTNEAADRKSTRLNSSHSGESRMPSSA